MSSGVKCLGGEMTSVEVSGGEMTESPFLTELRSCIFDHEYLDISFSYYAFTFCINSISLHTYLYDGDMNRESCIQNDCTNHVIMLLG